MVQGPSVQTCRIIAGACMLLHFGMHTKHHHRLGVGNTVAAHTHAVDNESASYLTGRLTPLVALRRVFQLSGAKVAPRDDHKRNSPQSIYSLHRLIRLSDAGAHTVVFARQAPRHHRQTQWHAPAVETEIYMLFAAVFLFGGSATAVPSPLEAKDRLYCVHTPCSLDDQ